MRKILSIIMVVALLCGTFSFVYAEYNSIATVDDLIALSQAVKESNDGLSGKTYKLVNNINMNNMDWTHFIGTTENSFKGVFDGNGHIIYNFRLRNTGVSDMSYGLFGVVGGNGVIKNMGVLNVECYEGNKTIAYSHSSIGGLVAELTDNASIDGCFAKNVKVATKTKGVATWSGFDGDQVSYAGGLIGKTTSDKVKVTNCYSIGFTEVDDSASTEGGLIGGVAEGMVSKVENCYSDTNITSCKDVDKDKFKNCYAADTKSWSSFGTRPGAQYEDGTLKASKLGNSFADINGVPALKWEKSFDGEGTKENPYSIKDVDSLISLSTETETKDKYYKLANDIDLDGMVWTNIIGTEAHSFDGVFDGNGHVIKNYKLSVEKTGFGAYYGLFGVVGSNGVVKNIGVENITVLSVNEWSYNAVVGGLIGVIKDNGKVANSYAKNMKFADDGYNVHTGGGLVGELYGDGAMVVNCYSVNCTEKKPDTVASHSGLIGIASKFYAIENSWSDNTLTMANHKDLSKVVNSYYFVNDDGTGYLRAGDLTKELNLEKLGEQYVAGENYPVQKWEKGLPSVEVEPGVPQKADEDTRPAPPVILETVEIATAEALMEVSTSAMAGVEYKLVADIDLGGMDWNDYVIAKPDAPFKGIFDGNNHVIRNFKINLPAGDYKEADGNELDLGLFGTLGGTGIIKNLGIENVLFYTTAKSGYNARGGALVAKIIDYGTVDNCFARNVVFDTRAVGAFFGEAAGLIGYVNGKGVCIANCYITGVEEKDDSIANDGGLIGPMKNFEKVENCYSTTTLSQCTQNNAEKIINSYCLNNTIWSTLGTRPGTLVTEEELENVNLGDGFVKDAKGINKGYPIFVWEKDFMPQKTAIGEIVTDGGVVKTVEVNEISGVSDLVVGLYKNGSLVKIKSIEIKDKGTYEVNLEMADADNVKAFVFIKP